MICSRQSDRLNIVYTLSLIQIYFGSHSTIPCHYTLIVLLLITTEERGILTIGTIFTDDYRIPLVNKLTFHLHHQIGDIPVSYTHLDVYKRQGTLSW